MSIYHKGKEQSEAYHNGKEVETIYHNGKLEWESLVASSLFEDGYTGVFADGFIDKCNDQ